MSQQEAGPPVSASSVVVASKQQTAADLAGEVILLSLETGLYYGLDQVGQRIWELVQQPARISEIRDAIASEYEVEASDCERDILDLLGQLVTAGLVEVRDAAESA